MNFNLRESHLHLRWNCCKSSVGHGQSHLSFARIAAGLYDMTQTSLAELMMGKEVGPKLINELMAAVNRVNYGQNCTLNAFAGMVGLVGSGADLRTAKEGFQQVRRSPFHLNAQ